MDRCLAGCVALQPVSSEFLTRVRSLGPRTHPPDPKQAYGEGQLNVRFSAHAVARHDQVFAFEPEINEIAF